MKAFLGSFAVALFITVSTSAHGQSNRGEIERIVKEFDKREEQSEGSTDRHYAWLKTKAGKRDAQILADNYTTLPDMGHLCMELARTGAVEIAPLVNKALADMPNGADALPGIFTLATSTSRKRLSVRLLHLPWHHGLNRLKYPTEHAIELLPILDADITRKTLLTDRFLSEKAPRVELVLEAFNEANLLIPLDRIEKLIGAWKDLAVLENTEYRIRRGYRGSVVALAKHQPDRAMKLAEELMKKVPSEAHVISDTSLSAAGLGTTQILYGAICEHIDDPKEFARLSHEARYYFAITCFENDASNGGYSQAFGNSTDNYFPIVKEGYAAIGAKNSLKTMELLGALFGPDGPSTDRAQRNRQMDAMKPSFEKQEERLMEKWAKEPLTSKADIIEEALLNRYAAQHADVLRPLIQSRYRNGGNDRPCTETGHAGA